MLEVMNLTKMYGKHESVTNLSFSVRKGDTVGLLGPNGAGKSTTMRMLTGYVAPTSGNISVMGENMLENPIAARKNIGYLPEIPPLYLEATVCEHLRFICDLRQIKKRDIDAEILRVCKDLHVEDVSHRPIKNLSKGYRQRVGFAAALIGSPKLLILDEPTVGLDPRQIIEIRQLIQRLSGKMSIIISSHILSEIASVCSRIIILNQGKMIANGTPAEIEADYAGNAVVEVKIQGDSEIMLDILRRCSDCDADIRREGKDRFYVSTSDGDALCSRIFREAANCADKLSLLTLHTQTRTLEQIFIELTQSGAVNSEGE